MKILGFKIDEPVAAKVRKVVSKGYCARAGRFSGSLSITCEDGEFRAKCPKCGGQKLKWANWYLAKIEREELDFECGDCGGRGDSSLMVIGDKIRLGLFYRLTRRLR